jgi:predicted membrane protein
VFFGIALVLFGALFLLDHLNMLSGYTAWQFWPLMFVLAGVLHLLGVGPTARRPFGLLLTGIGGVLLAHTLGFIDIHWGLIWPAAIIAVGVYLVFAVATRRWRPPKGGAGGTGGGSGDRVDGHVIMGDTEEQNDSQKFEGGEASAVMGSYELDLSRAEIAGEEADLYAKAVLGSVEVRVPERWRISVKGNPILGAVEDKTRMDPDPPENRKTLNVHSTAVLGSVEIRN